MDEDTNQTDDATSSEYTAALSPPPPLRSSPGKRVVGEAQQEKLRAYLDEDLMRITRKYIHRLDEDNTNKYHNLTELLGDLDRIIELIWYSINSTIGPNGRPTTFGYSQYLIRIADDLADFIEGYSTEPDPQQTIRILQKLDRMLSELIDTRVLNRTEGIRLESICERTRILVTKAFQGVHGYRVELGKVYEGVLDRTT
jgi:hypothetical protein